METYVRYEFAEKPDFTYLKEAGHNVVDSLSPFVIQEAVIDQDTGEIIEPAVFSNKYPVDIIYRNAAPCPELEAYVVTPTTPKHVISGKN